MWSHVIFLVACGSGFYFLPHVMWPLVMLASVLVWPWMAWESKKQIHKRNEEIERSWHAKPEALKALGAQLPETFTALDAGMVTQAIKKQGHMFRSKDGQKVVWAVIGDFNSQEALYNLETLCLYFEKLGKPELSKTLWAEAMKAYGVEKLDTVGETKS